MSIYDATINTLDQANTQQALTPAPTMSPTEASQVVSQYQVDPNAVLSASNISNTLTRPTAAPDDLLGIRSQINYDLGLDAQNRAYQDAMNAARMKVNALNSQVAGMEGQRVNLGVIRGEQGQARNLAAPEIERMQYQAALEQDKLNALTQERDYRLGVAEKNIDFTRNLKLQYPGAKIGFGDTLDTIESKLVKFQKDQKKEAEKDALKATARSLGISTKGKSTKQLEKKLKKYYKSERAYEEATRARQSQSDDISLALQKIQLQKARQSQASSNFNINDISSLFQTDKQSVMPSSNSSYWDYLNK